jgi:phosphatidate phosphatase APP1
VNKVMASAKQAGCVLSRQGGGLVSGIDGTIARSWVEKCCKTEGTLII